MGIIDVISRYSTGCKSIKWLKNSDGAICPHCGGYKNTSTPKSKKYTYWHKDRRKQFAAKKTDTTMRSSQIPDPKNGWLLFTMYPPLVKVFLVYN